jgi:hypothetical protein
MQGSYRVHDEDGDVIETFVAAPGPAGWRYFGRVLLPETEREIRTVDHVVDLEWRLVRYRERDETRGEVLIVPEEGGVTVFWSDERSVRLEGADVVWSRSPSSLLVAERRARASGATTLAGVRISTKQEPRALTISLHRHGIDRNRVDPGDRPLERVDVEEDGHAIGALIGEDAPVAADGWFELVG